MAEIVALHKTTESFLGTFGFQKKVLWYFYFCFLVVKKGQEFPERNTWPTAQEGKLLLRRIGYFRDLAGLVAGRSNTIVKYTNGVNISCERAGSTLTGLAPPGPRVFSKSTVYFPIDLKYGRPVANGVSGKTFPSKVPLTEACL